MRLATTLSLAALLLAGPALGQTTGTMGGAGAAPLPGAAPTFGAGGQAMASPHMRATLMNRSGMSMKNETKPQMGAGVRGRRGMMGLGAATPDAGTAPAQ